MGKDNKKLCDWLDGTPTTFVAIIALGVAFGAIVYVLMFLAWSRGL